MKKIIIALNVCILLSVVTIYILHALSTEMIYNNNSFLRVFPSHAMDQENHAIDLKYNSYYIAGTDKDHVYLANSTAPHTMLIANNALTDTQRVELKIKAPEKIKFTGISVAVDSPFFYLTDATLPGVFRGKIGEWEATPYSIDSIYFSLSLPISGNSLAFRANSSNTHEDFLLKHSQIPQLSKNGTGLLQKQVDGVFCVDGTLIKSKELSELIYLYYYRNQFIVADTSLVLKFRAHTIDTVSKAKIKISKKEFSTGLANPSALVNKQACTWRNYLFVNSNLMSKNDDKETFDIVAVVDVYDLLNRGAYKFSFRLFNHNQQRMRSFMSGPDKLFVINGSILLSYKPLEEYFKSI